MRKEQFKGSIDKIVVSHGKITLDEVVAVAQGHVCVEISIDKEFVERMEKSRLLLLGALKEGKTVYGVNTGYGGSCGNRIKIDHSQELGKNLIKYHGCGTGETLGGEEIRAAMLCRMICLSKGHSGVSINLLQHLADFLNNGITPIIPGIGSVGASGDLTPLSYIAAALAGERDVMYQGQCMPAKKALNIAGLKEYEFEIKEPIALLNGTSMMTGIAVVVLARSRKILEASIAATVLSDYALAGNKHHFHAAVVDSKNHVGQKFVGKKIRELLVDYSQPLESAENVNLQDPYSLRCAPQILGVLADALCWMETWVETEVNSVNDNPIIDIETGEILMGGNFYGGHISFAMDALKCALASVADMLDRQLALLVDPHFNHGLPANLVKIQGEIQSLHHGFKGLQITASALTAEAQKNSMPAAVFSRSTEAHNQDKVSMGTLAARDADKQCFLVSRVVAIGLIAASQACELRGGLDAQPRLAALVNRVRSVINENTEDRPLDDDIEKMAKILFEIEWLQ
jgi:histidine ammonia-lyase